MTATPATLTDFRDAFDFVSFADVSDAHVTQALERGNLRVKGWAGDYDCKLGAMLYAAHELTLAGLGAGAEAEIAKAGMLGFSSIRSGGLSVSRDTADSASRSGHNSLKSTRWGRRYSDMAFVQGAGPRVAHP